MNVSSRMPLLLAFLIGMFVAATGVAMAMLASFSDPFVITVAGIAALACIAAGAITWLILRAVQQEDVLELPELQEDVRVQPQAPSPIEALPAEELPQAYLAAVMKGIAANRAAMRARQLYH